MQEIGELHKMLEQAYSEKQTVSHNITETTSVMKATCEIWDSHADQVEKILFVEQMRE